jgi:hypothetical protein
MNDAPKQTTSQTTVIPGGEFANAGSDAVRQFCNQGQIFAKAMTDWNTECSRFVTHCMTRATEAAEQVASCRSLPEVFAIQARWLQATFDDYVQEADKLMEVNTQLVSNMVPQVGQVEIRQGPAKTAKVGS